MCNSMGVWGISRILNWIKSMTCDHESQCVANVQVTMPKAQYMIRRRYKECLNCHHKWDLVVTAERRPTI